MPYASLQCFYFLLNLYTAASLKPKNTKTRERSNIDEMTCSDFGISPSKGDVGEVCGTFFDRSSASLLPGIFGLSLRRRHGNSLHLP